ncbi:ascorbate transporter, chloroplastic isoform X4 [Raphanus sativus]|uniref:Ascorbate transporter, chloroplastic isoform X4 n=1 Tax=Raphanus sativus TaxID=3726 RepID=A0A9W3DE83_RAPSA|nr:ascorbate transporter, chloroplastic isoform X4 [Raphanus sativus]
MDRGVAMNKMLSKWIPVSERSTSLALVYSGMYLGSVTGLGFSPMLIHQFSIPLAPLEVYGFCYGLNMHIAIGWQIMQSIGFLGPAFFLSQLSRVKTPAMAVLCMACSQGSDAFSQSGLYSNHQDIGPRYAGPVNQSN